MCRTTPLARCSDPPVPDTESGGDDRLMAKKTPPPVKKATPKKATKKTPRPRPY